MVLSDDPAASRKIAAFADSDDRWMVAVRMVSEGVDIPRLAVGVYATSVGTALFFAQAVGRFVRARRRGETASVFLPSIPVLLGYAAELEAERDHVLAPRRRRRGGARAGRGAARSGTRRTSSTRRCRSRRWRRPPTSTGCCTTAASSAPPAEEEDFLGLPGLLEPEQVALLLRKRQAGELRAGSAASPRGTGRPGPPPRPAAAPAARPARETLGRAAQGAERPGRAPGTTAPASRTRAIHAELRRTCGGPPLPQATAEQIRARIETIRRWAVSGR